MAEYMQHLSRDKKLYAAIGAQEPRRLDAHKNICLRLISSIMSQQLSVKVARVFYGRFLELYQGNEPTAEMVAATPFETLRSIGLSNAKAQYVLNVAQFAVAEDLSDKRLKKMSNEEIIELLTQIKGVGRWTVEMLLMFTLGREDVFSVDDYGIQSAMRKIYKIPADISKPDLRKKLLKISDKWSPYRTYACLHLWASIDN